MKRLAQLAALLAFLGSVGTASAQTTQFNGIAKDLTGTPITIGTVVFTLKPGIDTTISGNARFTPMAINCSFAAPLLVSAIGNGATTTITVGVAQNWVIGDQLMFVGTGTSLDNFTAIAPATINGGTLSTNFTIASAFNGTVTVGNVGGLYAVASTGKCLVTQNSALNPAYTSYRVDIQAPSSGSTTSSFNTYAVGAGPIDISTIVPTPSQQPSYSFVDLFSNGQTISGLKSFTNSGNTYQGGTFASPILNNATFNTSTATNWTIITSTIQTPTFTGSPFKLGGNANIFNIAWAGPAANRTLTITDPLGNDSFTFNSATQTLANKTITAPTISAAAITSAPTQVAGYTTAGNVGIVPILSRSFEVQNIVASFGPTAIVTVPAGACGSCVVRLNYFLMTQVAGTGTTATLTLTWTDGDIPSAGVLTFTTATINLGVLGSYQQGSVIVQPGTTVINGTVTIAAIGTSKLAVYVTAELPD